MTTASHVAHCAPHIAQGISMLTLVISNITTAVVAAGLAWYIRGRGMTGVKIDIANAQNEIEKLKSQIGTKTSGTQAGPASTVLS